MDNMMDIDLDGSRVFNKQKPDKDLFDMEEDSELAQSIGPASNSDFGPDSQYPSSFGLGR